MNFLSPQPDIPLPPRAASRPPPAKSDADRVRQDHSALRRRILYGEHHSDVWTRIVNSVGPTRARAWLPLDMSANPLVTVGRQITALYREEPDIAGPDPEVLDAIGESGVWPLMQRVQRDVWGLGEELVLCDLDDDGQPMAHVIHPDLAVVDTDPRRPGSIIAAHWWEEDPRDAAKWVQWTVGRGGLYAARDEKGKDVTTDLRKGETGYPWLGQDGEPLMPVVAYHRDKTGAFWDPYTYSELIEGALQLSVLYTHYVHVVRQAAWMQRYLIGGRIAADLTETGEERVVTADPAVVLQLEAEEGVAQPVAGQWASPADPVKIIESIRIYERRLAEDAIGGVEVTRQSSDIRSAYSLAIGREERQAQQRIYAPVMRASDRQALRIWSELLAVRRGVEYPTVWPLRRGASRKEPADIEYVIGTLPDEPADVAA